MKRKIRKWKKVRFSMWIDERKIWCGTSEDLFDLAVVGGRDNWDFVVKNIRLELSFKDL
jgi:hypothetical protein